MAFGVVDVFEFHFVADGLDPLLQRRDFQVAGHDHDRLELQALGQVHRADGDAGAGLIATLRQLEGVEAGTCTAIWRSLISATATVWRWVWTMWRARKSLCKAWLASASPIEILTAKSSPPTSKVERRRRRSRWRTKGRKRLVESI